MEIALGMHGGDARDEKPDIMFGFITSPGLKRRKFSTDFLQHLTAAELRETLPEQFERYYRFAFVRNPWERMVSVYFYHRKTSGDVISFDEFVEGTENHQRNHHVCQHRYIEDEKGEGLVDFVGRFEHLDRDFAKVCEALNIERALPHIYAATVGDYRSYYNANTRKIVAHKYGEDIERFGYRFEQDD